jgi:hypothetical protein
MQRLYFSCQHMLRWFGGSVSRWFGGLVLSTAHKSMIIYKQEMCRCSLVAVPTVHIVILKIRRFILRNDSVNRVSCTVYHVFGLQVTPIPSYGRILKFLSKNALDCKREDFGIMRVFHAENRKRYSRKLQHVFCPG